MNIIDSIGNWSLCYVLKACGPNWNLYYTVVHKKRATFIF